MNLDAGVLVNIAMGLLTMGGVGIGAYVAVKADLARLHERVNASQAAADKAHSRIDDLVASRGFDRRASAD